MLTKYYLIKPNESLLSRAKSLPHEWVELVTQTHLWTKREGHRTTWKEDDRVVFVKLVFLASVSEYANLPGFVEVVGRLSFDTDFFDKNWTLEEINEVDDVDHVAKSLAGTVFAGKVHTDRPLVGEWLRELGIVGK